MTRTAMPSPRGTNLERLYLPATMAFDSKLQRHALDAMVQDSIEDLIAPLRGRLSDQVLLKIQADLADILVPAFHTAAQEGAGGREEEDTSQLDDDEIADRERAEGMGADARAGMARRGRARALEMFPGLGRIKQA